MADTYNTRFFGSFKDVYDNTFIVYINKKNYSGDSDEVKFTETPLIIDYPGDDRDITKPIFGSQAVINLLSMTDFQYIELHSSDARGYEVFISKNGSGYWRGWLLPDLFTEPYEAAPYTVSITARCGLGELNEHFIGETIAQLRRAEDDELVSTTTPDLYSIIANGLIRVGHALKLNECISVYASTNDDPSNYSPLADTKVNIDAYVGMSYYDAISDILKTFGARLYQMDEEWWIVRTKEYQTDMQVRQWDVRFNGVNTFTYSDTKTTTFKIGRPEGSDILTNGPRLDILPAWKNISFNQSLGKRDNILLNGDFTQYYKKPTSSPALNAVGIYNIYPPLFWDFEINTDKEPSCRTFWDSNGDYYLYFLITEKISQSIDIEEGDYIVPPYATFQQRLQIEIDAAFVAGPSATMRLEIKISGTSDKYLYFDVSDQANPYKWTSTPSYIDITNLANNNSPVGLSEFSSIAILSDEIPLDGTLTISFENIDYTSGAKLALRSVVMSIAKDPVDPNGFPESQETTVDINSNNVYTQSPLQTVGGDLPDIPNNTLIWKNGYRKSSLTPTVEWHEYGNADEYPLLELTMMDYKERLLLPQFKLSLPIRSNSIQFDSSIVDYQVLPKKYICNAMSCDIRNAIYSGTFIEFATWEGADWILEDGTWDDNGIWDDGETWNDTDPTP